MKFFKNQFQRETGWNYNLFISPMKKKFTNQSQFHKHFYKAYQSWLENKLQEAMKSEIAINCVHEYEYLSTSGFKGYKCKKCGQSINIT